MEQALYLQPCSPHGAMFTGSGSDSLVINDALQMYLLTYLLTYIYVCAKNPCTIYQVASDRWA